MKQSPSVTAGWGGGVQCVSPSSGLCDDDVDDDYYFVERGRRSGVVVVVGYRTSAVTMLFRGFETSLRKTLANRPRYFKSGC